jgi:hypothetical protein
MDFDYKSALKNLLAMIHGDGGHYVERHGIEKACEDAEEKVAKIFTEYFESKK